MKPEKQSRSSICDEEEVQLDPYEFNDQDRLENKRQADATSGIHSNIPSVIVESAAPTSIKKQKL